MSGSGVRLSLLVLTVALACHSGVGDWVEIPFLQPSTTTTQRAIVIRKNIQRPSFIAESNFMSHVLPVESDDLEDEGLSLLVTQATLSPARISNLVDLEELAESPTTAANPISAFSNFQKRFYEYPRSNISGNLGWTSAKDEVHFVTGNRQQQPSTMSNKYQEESIEDPAPAIDDRIELPVDGSSAEEEEPTVDEKPPDRFNDFDDYDERAPDDSFRNVTTVIAKRRRRPVAPGRVTIVKVVPPRRRRPLRPADSGGLSGFVAFLKQMQDRFMQRTAKNIGDKIRILQDLKDQLLLSIERRMSTLWREPPAEDNRRRVKRGGGWMEHGDGGHGGMDFPSAEAALLTISFLTFAVFLIKLVLQVINTIKAKHYTYNTMTGLNGLNSATLKIVNRSKRDATKVANDERWHGDLKILSAIHDYKFT